MGAWTHTGWGGGCCLLSTSKGAAVLGSPCASFCLLPRGGALEASCLPKPLAPCKDPRRPRFGLHVSKHWKPAWGHLLPLLVWLPLAKCSGPPGSPLPTGWPPGAAEQTGPALAGLLPSSPDSPGLKSSGSCWGGFLPRRGGTFSAGNVSGQTGSLRSMNGGSSFRKEPPPPSPGGGTALALLCSLAGPWGEGSVPGLGDSRPACKQRCLGLIGTLDLASQGERLPGALRAVEKPTCPPVKGLVAGTGSGWHGPGATGEGGGVLQRQAPGGCPC